MAHKKVWAAGLAIGTVLAWLNFRWLKRGLDALVLASKAQEGREKPQVPLATYFTAIFRYGLLALAVYIFLIAFTLTGFGFTIGGHTIARATLVATAAAG